MFNIKSFNKCAILALALMPFGTRAQFTVSPNQTAAQLVSSLVGTSSGVFVSNATLVCPSGGSGGFASNATPVNISNGIVLSSGTISTIPGPASTLSSNSFNAAGDADLASIVGNVATRDACVLEFDFIPSGDTIRFDYQFGSEEYPGYACTQFNDVFGFFITGPGYPVKTNIARIPNTNIPVTINSTSGVVGTSGGNIATCNAMGTGSPFTQYYINNTGGPSITYNGLTTVFTAKAPVTPCASYHFKLGIADAIDNSYNSAVFLKAGSLVSSPVITSVTPAANAWPLSGGISVTLNGNNFKPGSAVTFDGTSITPTSITPNAISFVLPAISPAACAGNIVVTSPSSCGALSSSFTYNITTAPVITSVSPLNGVAGTNLVISGTNLGANSIVKIAGINMPVVSSSYTQIVATIPANVCGNNAIVVTNNCGINSSAFVYNVPAPVVANVTSVQPTCPGGNDGVLTLTAASGAGNYLYSINGGVSYQGSNIFNGLTAGNYNIVVRDMSGCTGAGTGLVPAGTDNMPPSIPVLPVVNANTDAGVCGATVSLAIPAATDNCGVGSISNNAPLIYNVGVTTVTWTVTDVNGNITTVNQTVIVTDNELPIVATNNISVSLDAAGAASITAVDVNNASSDACGIQSMTVSPDVFTCANVGANTVILTVTDANGNVATNTAVVTVVDNTAPAVATQNMTVQLDAAGNAAISAADVDNGSSDICGIQTMSVSPNSFTCANIGANTVTLTVTDVNGNTSSNTAVVTVEDKIAPAVVCAANITVSCDASTATSNTGVATATDACGVADIAYADVSTQDANVNNAGHYNYAITRTWTATDIHGNVSTCVQTINVIDVVAPSITCPANTLASCKTAPANNGTATGTDICSPVSISYTDASTKSTNTSSSSYYDYVITRTWAAMDVSGNTATCNQVINVSELRGAAIAVTPVNTINSNHADYTIYLGYGPQSVTLAASVQGGVGNSTYSWAPTTGVASANSATTSVAPVVTTTYTVTITDATGCTTQKSIKINVVDVRCGKKVQICHFPPGNPGNAQQLCLPESAIQAHLAHGCRLGACPQFKNSNANNDEESNLTELVTDLIKVYPNPNNGQFMIELPAGMENAEVTVMDMTGRVVLKGNVASGKAQINMGDVSRGVYMINVTSGDQHYRTRVSVQ